MTFEQPVPDLAKIQAAWERWETGEDSPGRVMADMKTAGMSTVLTELAEQGWAPSN